MFGGRKKKRTAQKGIIIWYFIFHQNKKNEQKWIYTKNIRMTFNNKKKYNEIV